MRHGGGLSAMAQTTRWTAGVAAAVLLLVACSPSGGTSPAPRATATAALHFAPCGGAAPAAQCARLQVDSGAGIAVVRIPARDTRHRIGVLFFNPGGPGASAVQAVEQDAMPLLDDLNQRFDLVAFDQRGTGASQPLQCAGTALLDRLVGDDPIADDRAEHEQLVDDTRAVLAGCRSAARLTQISTDVAAEDMDRVRAALGEQRISLLGISYGSLLGTRYAAAFPQRVRAMALDGDVDPSLPMLQTAADQADGLEASYREFLRRCAARPSCALGSDPGATVDALLASLDRAPVAASDGRLVGRGTALNALAGAMYAPAAWPEVERVLAGAVHGRVDPLQRIADAYAGRSPSGYDPSLVSGTAIRCADAPAPHDLPVWDAAARAAQGRDPHFGAAAVEGLLACAFWTQPSGATAPARVSDTPPILLVGALHDPATPYAWSLGLQRQIAGARLLTRDGWGHPSIANSQCVAAAVTAYLLDPTRGEVPQSCASD
jgi:pimeloyl-ACP methyl ester carboxylesterase